MTYPCVCALELEEAVSRQRGDGVSLLPVPQLLDKLLLLSPTVHFVACAVTEICGRITLHCVPVSSSQGSYRGENPGLRPAPEG